MGFEWGCAQFVFKSSLFTPRLWYNIWVKKKRNLEINKSQFNKFNKSKTNTLLWGWENGREEERGVRERKRERKRERERARERRVSLWYRMVIISNEVNYD